MWWERFHKFFDEVDWDFVCILVLIWSVLVSLGIIIAKAITGG